MSRKQWGHGFHTGVEAHQKRQEGPSMEDDEKTVKWLVRRYIAGELSKGQLTICVPAIIGSWDFMLRSFHYAMIEATLKEHFCEWWDTCEKSHDESMVPAWKDGWSTIFDLDRFTAKFKTKRGNHDGHVHDQVSGRSGSG